MSTTNKLLPHLIVYTLDKTKRSNTNQSQTPRSGRTHLQVFLPLFTNDKNHKSWPKVVSQDVSRNVESLKSKIFMVAGHIKGKTMLPLPIGSEKDDYVKELDRYQLRVVVVDIFWPCFVFGVNRTTELSFLRVFLGRAVQKKKKKKSETRRRMRRRRKRK